MARQKDIEVKAEKWSRRRFFATGGVALSAAATAHLSGCAHAGSGKSPPGAGPGAPANQAVQKPRIQRYRTLGRTGFQVSDVSLGCGRIGESSLVRYACDRGITYFDTAEAYGNGDSEKKIGEAMPYLDRKKIFLSTKLGVKPEDTEQTLLDRFARCLERLKTDHVDALYMHCPATVEALKNPVFHKVSARLKADSKIGHVGVSSHGPHGAEGESMEKVLCAAADDGRFDLMLLVYNFLNKAEGEKVLAACKAKNIGTTGMKASPGTLKLEPFDPENPTGEYAEHLKEMVARGMTREEAILRLQKYAKRAEGEMSKNKPLLEPYLQKFAIQTQDDLDLKSVEWVLGNPDLHTVCVSMSDFDRMDRFVPLSGSQISHEGLALLDAYERTAGRQHCRHGCNACVGHCPHGLAVSTVMRYAYYFHLQGREKQAMEQYARLRGKNASLCLDCDAPCLQGCPHGVAVQANLLRAHALLTLA